LSANCRRKGVVHQRILALKTRVSGLSRGVVCVILLLAVLIQYQRVTDTQTDRQTHRHTDTYRHKMMAITRASLAPRG